MGNIEVRSARQAQIRLCRTLYTKAKTRSLDLILMQEKTTGEFLIGWWQGRRRKTMRGDQTIRFYCNEAAKPLYGEG